MWTQTQTQTQTQMRAQLEIQIQIHKHCLYTQAQTQTWTQTDTQTPLNLLIDAALRTKVVGIQTRLMSVANLKLILKIHFGTQHRAMVCKIRWMDANELQSSSHMKGLIKCYKYPNVRFDNDVQWLLVSILCATKMAKLHVSLSKGIKWNKGSMHTYLYSVVVSF